VAEGYGFTDGLCTDAEGNLYFSDVKQGTAIYQVDLEGNVSEFIKDAAGISGLQWGADGKLYACVARGRIVVCFDKEGNMTQLADEVRPNDLVVTHDGNLYFTMTPTSEIRRIDPEGNLTVVSSGDVTKPNGITLSPDQGTLAVSDHGGKFVWAFRIRKDGSLDAAQEYMPMRTPVADPEVAKGDGMATDIHGRWYVTTAMGLQMFDPTGRMGGVVQMNRSLGQISAPVGGWAALRLSRNGPIPAVHCPRYPRTGISRSLSCPLRINWAGCGCPTCPSSCPIGRVRVPTGPVRRGSAMSLLVRPCCWLPSVSRS